LLTKGRVSGTERGVDGRPSPTAAGMVLVPGGLAVPKGGIDGTKGGVDGRLSLIVVSMVLVPRELKYVINFTTNKKPLKLDF